MEPEQCSGRALFPSLTPREAMLLVELKQGEKGRQLAKRREECVPRRAIQRQITLVGKDKWEEQMRENSEWGRQAENGGQTRYC